MRIVRAFKNLIGWGSEQGDLSASPGKATSYSLYQNNLDRSTYCKKIDTVDKNDIIFSRGLDLLKEEVAVFPEPVNERDSGIYIESENSRIEDVLNSMLIRTGLDIRASSFVRSMIKYGNYFLRVNIDSRNSLIKSIIPFRYPYYVHRHVDKNGQLISGKGAFTYEPPSSGDDEEFYPWDVVHLKFGVDEGSGYPTPMFTQVISLIEKERALEVRFAKDKSSPPYTRIFKIMCPGSMTREQKKAIVDGFKDALYQGREPEVDSSGNFLTTSESHIPEDIFVPVEYIYGSESVKQEIDVEIKETPSGNVEVDDLIYYLNLKFTALGVPPERLFWDVQRSRQFAASGGDTTKDKPFIKRCRSIQNSFIRDINKTFVVELLLNGFIPPFPDYKVVMPQIDPDTRTEKMKNALMAAQVASAAAQAGIPGVDDWLADVIGMDESSKEEIDAMLEKMAGEGANE